MKIVRFTAENFKRLVAVEITPKGNTVLITGKNGAGKSSVLDAIVSVLQGKKYTPLKPIRDGEDHAEVVIETENWIIKRTFTSTGGGSVTITNQEGQKASSPQALLDKIVGEIAFDPMAFINDYDSRKQREVLMKLAGLDFSDIETAIATVKQNRSKVRSFKETYEHDANRITVAADVPNEEVSVTELSEKLTIAVEHNAAQSQIRTEIENIATAIDGYGETISNQEKLVVQLEEQLATANENLTLTGKTRTKYVSRKTELANLLEPTIAVEVIQTEIATLDETNRAVRLKREKKALQKKAAAKTAEYSQLGQKMKQIEDEKAKRLSEAKMPLPGLSVTEDGVIYEGIPLSQVNDAKQLEIGMNIAMAENPELRVIKMKGNDLDSASLELISKMAIDNDFQVWIERWHSEDGKGGIVIEDGQIKE